MAGIAVTRGYTQSHGQLLLTALTVGSLSIIGISMNAVLNRGRYSLFPRVGLPICLASTGLLVAGIWASPDSDGYWQATAIVCGFGISLAQACWLLLWEPTGVVGRFIFRILIFMALCLGVCVVVATTLEIGFGAFWRWVAFFIFIELLAGIIAPILPALSAFFGYLWHVLRAILPGHDLKNLGASD